MTAITIFVFASILHIPLVECSLSSPSVLIQDHSSLRNRHEKERRQYPSFIPNTNVPKKKEGSSYKNCDEHLLSNPIIEYVNHATYSGLENVAQSEVNIPDDIIYDKLRISNQPTKTALIPNSSVFMNFLSSMVSIYARNLEQFPLCSKMFSAGIIGAVGDLLSQYYEYTLVKKHEQGSLSMRTSLYDLRRNFAVFLEGVLISGPVMHYTYNFYESIFPVESTNNIKGNIMAAAQVMADCLIMDPFYVLSAMIIVGLFEGFSFSKVLIPQLKTDFLPSTKMAWISSLLLSPLQYFTVRYLPLNWRVVSVSMQGTIWQAIVMFMAHKGRT